MSDKKFIYGLFISVFCLFVIIGVRNLNEAKEKNGLEFYYTYGTADEINAYKEDGVDNFLWRKSQFGNNDFENPDTRYMILKLRLPEGVDNGKILHVRVRNKIVELYIDHKLIKRNAAVAEGNINNYLTAYYDFDIPVISEYKNKDFEFFIEAPLKADLNVLGKLEVSTAVDFFSINSMSDTVYALFIMLAIITILLCCTHIYWLRNTIQTKFYRVGIPVVLFMLAILTYIPYYQIKWYNHNQMISAIGFILTIISLYITLNGLRYSSRNRTVLLIINTLLVMLYVFSVMIFSGIYFEGINWAYAHFLSEKVIVFSGILILSFAYINANNISDIFIKPAKIFCGTMLVVACCESVVYCMYPNISPYFLWNICIIVLIIAILIFASFIIDSFHTKLYENIINFSDERNIYEHIEFSRDDKLVDRTANTGEIYNNFSVGYIQSIIKTGDNILVISLILRQVANNDIEVVFADDNFGQLDLSNQERNFYLTLYKNIFNDNNINTKRKGNTIYLGFKESNLYYFMIISSKFNISDLKFKAMENYAKNIKSTANNYVITGYIEEARNDVIKSFGKTIESRMTSNNYIGVTDKFVEFIARVMEKSELEVHTLKTASYIKNIGSIIMSENELKGFSNMTDEQLKNAYKRSEYGFEILKKFEDTILSKAAIMSKYQFECYNGRGPLGLIGEEIPDEGKFIKFAMCMTIAVRQCEDAEHIFEEIFDYINDNFLDIVSKDIFEKCKFNNDLFNELVVKDEEFKKGVKMLNELDKMDYIF